MPSVVRSVLALVAVSTLLLAAPAAAHDTLVESRPGADEVLTAPPTEIALRFSADLLDLSPAVRVTDAAGQVVAEGAPTIEGSWARLPLEELPAGGYDVTWSVVSSDGHRIEGQLAFTVERSADDATGTAPEEAASPDATPGPGTTPSPDATPSPDTTPSPEESPGTTEEPGGLSGWRLGLLVVGGLGALATLVALLVRRSGGGPF